MVYSKKCLIVITSLMASMVVQSSGELIVVGHPPTDNGRTREVTCISQDDDAALIWNYNSTTITNDFTSSRSDDLNSQTKNRCDIGTWNSTSCFVEWDGNFQGWETANSISRPMGPVYDYRWGGFDESIVDGRGYLSFDQVSSDTVVISVKESRKVKIGVCNRNTKVTGACIWIVIGSGSTEQSKILTCNKGVPSDSPEGNKHNCADIAKAKRKQKKVSGIHVWSTFTIEWGGDGNIVKVFEATDKVPFLTGDVTKSFSQSNIIIYGDTGTRIRFHKYDYSYTERDEAVISTVPFTPTKENVCFELLVGLCSKCEMQINLFDKTAGVYIATKTISGDEKSMINGLLSWLSISVKTNATKPRHELILHVRTIPHKGKKNKGHWALDKVRVCKAVGTIRKSTIKIHEDMKPLSPAVCQKLSYSDSDVIDLSVKSPHNHDTTHLQQLLNIWRKSCGSSCVSFGKGSLICNSNGCSCDRGYQGKDCTKECSPGFYGYNCNEKCESCKDEKCNKETGDCKKGCKSIQFTGSLCQRDPNYVAIQEIEDLRLKTLTSTKAMIQWTLSLTSDKKNNLFRVVVENLGVIGCKEPQKVKDIVDAFSYSDSFRIPDLRPYTNHRAIVTPYLNGAKGKTFDFQTKERDIPTSMVDDLHIDNSTNRIEWSKPVDCVTITGSTKYTNLQIIRVNDSKSIKKVTTEESYYALNSLDLDPFTSYKAHARVSRDKDGQRINQTAYREASWLTPAAVPPKVTKLEVYAANSDEYTISLRWLPPNPARGRIEAYHVFMGSRHEILKVKNGNKTKCLKDYVCFENFKVPKDAVANKTKLMVSAKNADVVKLGTPETILFEPVSYYKKPSQPSLNVTAKNGGIIELKWAHPTICYTPILRFDIRAEVQGHKLLVPPDKKKIKFKHVVKNEQPYYTKNLPLPTSTYFRISLVAVNMKNLTSSAAEVFAWTQEGLAFAIEEELKVEQNKMNGTWIDIVVPTILNATNDTWINIAVVGPSTCPKNNSQTSKPQEWNITEYRVDGKGPKHLTIGDNHNDSVALNCYLLLGENYTVIANIVTKDQGSPKEFARITSESITLIENKSTSNGAWFVIILIVTILLILILILYFIQRRKTHKNTPLQVTYSEIQPLENRRNAITESEDKNLTVSSNRQSSTPLLNHESRVSLSPLYAVPFVPKSGSVSMMCFEEYAKEIAFSGLLATQYTTFPRGLTRRCDYGRLPENMPKNRNKNLIAYDETRVILDKIPGKPHSDYINANYIQGYSEKKAYIATQGPKPNTVDDFWRMIWQNKVVVICMLTNVMEDGEKMCEEYWPAVGSEVKHGDITVLNIEHKVFADYTIRTFAIRKKDETQKVMHLHYTGWPSRGVPMYSQSLVAYLKKLVEILDGRGPVVVHCSEGDGRTGTVILCDMCVRQGIVERDIDVPSIAQQMCNSRPNMIGSPQQYLLAHVVIAESIASISTQIPCTDVLPVRIRALKKHLSSHVERLNRSVWQERALHSFASSERVISGMSFSNKLPELIPVGLDVVNYQRYTSLIDNDSNYIGAISVDGVRVKNQNLTSRLPSGSGLPDFWRFVAEQNIEFIVILQRPETDDSMFCDIMPGDSILVPVPYIQILTKSSFNERGIFTIDKLILTDSSEETTRSQSVTVLTCSGWGCGSDGKPPAPGELVSLWQASENIPRKGGLSLVLCRNGVTACGLYLAMSFLLERMAVDRECDVISAVRAVRRSRPEFVQSLEQFDYLYDAALNYAGCFQTYANFS